MKISIITVSYNSASTIDDTIRSVLSQSYGDLEYIVVDGLSTDGTVERVRSYGSRIHTFISEKDGGIYDAMNKGISLATGDAVAFLNSDDFYIHGEVVERVVRRFQTDGTDAVFGDLVMVRQNETDKVVRYYDSGGFRSELFGRGIMPAHPAFFLKRECFEKYGNFDISYRVAADFELLARMISRYGISYSHIPEVLVKMRMGGISTGGIESTLLLNREILRACRQNDIPSSILKVYSKYIKKVFQLIKRPVN
jgi:glycosyltransferase involved in cell wall biosynthesis